MYTPGIEVFVTAAEVLQAWNLITSYRILAAELVMFPIFSYFAYHATGVSLIVAFVKYMIGELEPIAVTKTALSGQLVFQANVRVRQRKERDVKTKQPIQMGAAICIKFYQIFYKA